MAPAMGISKVTGPYIQVPTDSGKLETATVTVTSVASSPTSFTSDTTPASVLVLDPSLITQDFDLLRLEAAASGQLAIPGPATPSPVASTQERIQKALTYTTLLISSPYNNPNHYLDLTSLSIPYLLFAKALTSLRPARPDYATAPYTSALNFSTVLSVLRDLSSVENINFPQTSFYVVTFRSKLKSGIDNDWLYKLDYESHREACESGGLLKYWFGKADEERRNLATCKYCLSSHN